MVVLFFGDIYGKPGRRAIQKSLPLLKQKYEPDFILGNVENLAGGRGVNNKCFNEMINLGFHGFTSGNHIWDNKEVYGLFEKGAPLVRPANYPSPEGFPCPGYGATVIRNQAGQEIFVINLMGRVFMENTDCPFALVDQILREQKSSAPILVDMHADATSEKNAMGWFLDGRVAAVVGTHSHVQTADERVLPAGTAYITDIGMSGSFDSVIGLRPHEVIRKFLTKRPHPVAAAKENLGISCVVIQISPNQRAQSIERIRTTVDVPEFLDEKDLE